MYPYVRVFLRIFEGVENWGFESFDGLRVFEGYFLKCFKLGYYGYDSHMALLLTKYLKF